MNSGNHGNRESPLRCSAWVELMQRTTWLLCVLKQKLFVWEKDKVWEAKKDGQTDKKKETRREQWKILAISWADNVLHGYTKWKCFIGRLLNEVDILLFNRCWGAVILSFHWYLWNCCYESSLSLYGLPTHWHLQNVNSHAIEKSTNNVSCLRMSSEVMHVFR